MHALIRWLIPRAGEMCLMLSQIPPIDVESLRGYRVTWGQPVPHRHTDRNSYSCCMISAGTSPGRRVTVRPQSQHLTSMWVMPWENSLSVVATERILSKESLQI